MNNQVTDTAGFVIGSINTIIFTNYNAAISAVLRESSDENRLSMHQPDHGVQRQPDISIEIIF